MPKDDQARAEHEGADERCVLEQSRLGAVLRDGRNGRADAVGDKEVLPEYDAEESRRTEEEEGVALVAEPAGMPWSAT